MRSENSLPCRSRTKNMCMWFCAQKQVNSYVLMRNWKIMIVLCTMATYQKVNLISFCMRSSKLLPFLVRKNSQNSIWWNFLIRYPQVVIKKIHWHAAKESLFYHLELIFTPIVLLMTDFGSQKWKNTQYCFWLQKKFKKSTQQFFYPPPPNCE